MFRRRLQRAPDAGGRQISQMPLELAGGVREVCDCIGPAAERTRSLGTPAYRDNP